MIFEMFKSILEKRYLSRALMPAFWYGKKTKRLKKKSG